MTENGNVIKIQTIFWYDFISLKSDVFYGIIQQMKKVQIYSLNDQKLDKSILETTWKPVLS